MKRLTYKVDGNWYINGVNGKLSSDIHANHYGEAIDRLAEYEDTGLTPEDIQEAVDLFKDWKDADIPKELKSWVERCTWHVRKCEELLRELDKYKKVVRELQSRLYEASDGFKQAEEQDLLVRLPCKLGDTVYDISEFVERTSCAEMYEFHADYIGIGKSDDGRTVISIDCMDYYMDDFGKIVFTSREAAEKALEDA